MGIQISILIATYNSGKTLGRCLESVLSQELFGWECIVIDGASKDTTLEIIAEYERKDCRFKHISEPDKGIYDALNKGLKIAKGEWVYVLGSDDWLTREGLNTLIKYKKPGIGAIYGNIIAAYNNGTQRVITPKPIKMMRYYMPISHQGVIVRLDSIREVGAFDLKYIVRSDYDMMQKLYLAGISFQYIDTNVNYCGMNGLSNKFISNVKYDWERYMINKKNHANKIPFLSWLYIEIKILLVFIRDKFLKRK